ncbi:hypothetical protein vBValCWD615_12 [Vibrio phage vB_ValC_WD615]|nr:hypothetical protein vBValCWD615_12 [Vibrio phage vB_ValC_WD615]
MKFETQHIKVKGQGGRAGYSLHRDKNVTWKTAGEKGAISDTIVHESCAAARKHLNESRLSA